MNLALEFLESATAALSQAQGVKPLVSLTRISGALGSLTRQELSALMKSLHDVSDQDDADAIKQEIIRAIAREIGLHEAASKQVVKTQPKASRLLQAIELLNIEELKSLTYALGVIGLERLPRYTAERLVQRINLVLRQSRPRVLQ